jgi:hypothetical protein
MERYYPTNSVRPDEVFWKTNQSPFMETWGWTNLLYRRVEWRVWPWVFRSHVLLWFIRWYNGDGKIDPTQTYRLRAEQPPYREGYAVATTPKERFSFRLSWRTPDRERWDNMGGI